MATPPASLYILNCQTEGLERVFVRVRQMAQLGATTPANASGNGGIVETASTPVTLSVLGSL
jgi:hypothetical protein